MARYVGGSIVADRVPEALLALRVAVRILGNVVNDIVIARGAHTRRHIVQVGSVAELPSDEVMVRGSIATHANGAHELALARVQGEPAAEHVHSADFSA